MKIIPPFATLEGTVRTLDPEVRAFIQTRIEEITQGLAKAARATCEVTCDCTMPAVNNDARLTAQVYELLRKVFPSGMVTAAFAPSMGCEEFALFQEQIPGLFLFIGNDQQGCRTIPLHSPS